jgi:hypothetical protein
MDGRGKMEEGSNKKKRDERREKKMEDGRWKMEAKNQERR